MRMPGRRGNGEWGMGNGEWGMGNGEWPNPFLRPISRTIAVVEDTRRVFTKNETNGRYNGATQRFLARLCGTTERGAPLKSASLSRMLDRWKGSGSVGLARWGSLSAMHLSSVRH
jgi:hypothetical protein